MSYREISRGYAGASWRKAGCVCVFKTARIRNVCLKVQELLLFSGAGMVNLTFTPQNIVSNSFDVEILLLLRCN